MSDFMTSPPGAITLLVIVGVLMWRQRQTLRQIWMRRRVAFEPGVEPLQKLCLLVDRSVSKRFRPRSPGETLGQFAVALRDAAGTGEAGDPMLRETAEWYVRYSAIRYSTPLSRESVDELSREAQALVRPQ